MNYIYIDLFSAIGGFALGASMAGMKFEKHYYSEIDPYCKKLYSVRFPEAIPLGDITKIDATKLPKGKYIITGGFPCQDISIAGKGKGIEGPRSNLWFDMWRIIRVLQPRFAIIENVGMLANKGLDTVLKNLAEIGYNAEWQDIRAEDVGAPHRRERIWIVAYSYSGWGQKDNVQTRWNAAGGSNKKISYTADISRNSKYKNERQKSQKISGKRFNGNRGNWEIEPGVDRLADGVSHRVDRLRGLGNAIVPQIAQILFELIKEHL